MCTQPNMKFACCVNKKKKSKVKTLFFSRVTFTCLTSVTRAYDFVIWNDYIYKVSEVYVQKIEKEIGVVTSYTRDDEYKRHRGNFSNVYEEGTKYYSIVGISTDEAIAIKESDSRYIKAYREGEYEVRSAFDGFFDGQQGIIKILIFSILGILAVVLLYKVLKKNLGKR